MKITGVSQQKRPEHPTSLIGRRRAAVARPASLPVSSRGEATAYWEAAYRALLHRTEWHLALLDLAQLGSSSPSSQVDRALLADRRDALRRRAAHWSSRRSRLTPAEAGEPASAAEVTGSWQDRSALETLETLAGSQAG
jgi:hypothetical protein